MANNNITSANITTKAKIITTAKALLLSLIVVSIIQIIADRLIIAIVMSDITLWLNWSNNYWLRYWSMVVIFAVIYYFKRLNKIIENAKKSTDKLSYHLYDNSNPQ